MLSREVNASKTIAPIFEAQTLTYMKLIEAPQGLILNFNCVNIFSEVQKKFINDFTDFRRLNAPNDQNAYN
ncbi:MAG: GxxExxY protein [Pedobacter agri]|uniref:GxxExxY protein n=1 Tax=Pedobacter agri TaxID=454586 RepID=UPI000A04CD39